VPEAAAIRNRRSGEVAGPGAVVAGRFPAPRL